MCLRRTPLRERAEPQQHRRSLMFQQLPFSLNSWLRTCACKRAVSDHVHLGEAFGTPPKSTNLELKCRVQPPAPRHGAAHLSNNGCVPNCCENNKSDASQKYQLQRRGSLRLRSPNGGPEFGAWDAPDTSYLSWPTWSLVASHSQQQLSLP